MPLGIEDLTARVRETVGREPLVFVHGLDRIERVAICSGAAGRFLIDAAHQGYDLLLTGEPEEPSLQLPASSASTSWPVVTTQPSDSASRRCPRDSPSSSASTGSSSASKILCLRRVRRNGAADGARRRSSRREDAGRHGRTQAIPPAHLRQRVQDGMRPLDDHEVAAVGDEAQLRAEPARVLERVVERQLRVSGAREDHDRARDLREGRGADRLRSSRGPRPSYPCAGAVGEARPSSRGVSATGSETNQGRKTARRYQTRLAQRWRKRATARPRADPADVITSASRRHRDLVAMPAGRRAAARGRAPAGFRASRSATRPPSEWPATTATSTPSASSTAAVAAAKSVHRRAASRRPRARVAGKVDCDHAVATTSSGSTSTQFQRAAEPVDEQHRVALPADVVLDRAREPVVSRVVAAVMRAKYPWLTMAIVGARAR